MKHSWVEVDLNRLRKNIRAVRMAVAERTEIVFVVKADAYGHGMLPLSQVAAEEGVRWFAVVLVDEAAKLRTVLPGANLVVIGEAHPEDIEVLLENKIIPVVLDLQHGLALGAAARRLGRVLPVHLKVDTGMGRVGIQWDEVSNVWKKLQEAGGLDVTGICSHLASVDPADDPDKAVQCSRFKTVIRQLPPTLFRHLSNSRGAMYFSDWDFDGVRQGIGVYGYEVTDPSARFNTRPILQWKTRVSQIKKVPSGFCAGYDSTWCAPQPTQIATLPIGYSDGYNRALSNRGVVLIGGRRCPVVGRVSMNWITVDVGPEADVQAGDEAVLLGEQGDEAFWADEMAALCGTISYEILTGIHASLERRYTD